MAKEIITPENVEIASRIPGWLITLLGPIGTAILAGVAVWIQRIFKSRNSKKEDKAHARKAVVEAELAEIDQDEKEIEVANSRADRAWARSEQLENRIDFLITEIDRIKDELAATKLEVIAERNSRIEAEFERDMYKGKLGKLLKAIVDCDCPINIEDYK